MVNTITLKSLRPGLPGVIDNIDSRLDRYIVTRRGKPVCAMISIEDYEEMLETIEILSDPVVMKRIGKARKELAAGKGISLEKALKDLERV